MKRLASFGRMTAAAALAAALVQHVGYLTPPNATDVRVFLALAVLGLIVGRTRAAESLSSPQSARGTDADATIGSALMFGLGGILLTFAFDGYELAGGLVLAGASLKLLRSRWSLFAAAAGSAIRVGALFGLGLLLVPLWARFEILQPDFVWMSRGLAALVSGLGGEATINEGRLHLAGPTGTTALLIDVFKLGGLFLAAAFVFAASLEGLARGPRRALRWLVVGGAVTALYLPLRLLAIASLDTLTQPFRFLIDPVLLLASFLPLLLVWTFIAGDDDVTSGEEEVVAPSTSGAHPAVRLRRISLAAVAGALLIALGTTLHDGGSARPGKVVLDESHSDWEVTDIAFNRENFGRSSTYNYHGLSELFDRHFDFEVWAEGKIDAARLEGVQTLILKTPTEPYSEDEVATILDFVREGGGLWLVGDHTNLYGMSDVLNRFAVPAGMRFRPDATYDALSGWTTLHEERAPTHPITAQSDQMAYQTSCSVEALRPDVEPLLVGWRLTGEDADYGNPNFFGNMQSDLEDRTGILLQGGVGRIGKGRVAIFSDSTILSNFALFEAGVSEMAIRTAAFLSATDRWPRPWRPLSLSLGFAALIYALGASAVFRPRAFDAATLGIVAATLMGTTLVKELQGDVIDVPDSRRDYRTVAFLESPSSFRTSTFVEEAQESAKRTDSVAGRSISTFFNWALRLDNTRPVWCVDATELDPERHHAVVMFEPDLAPDTANYASLARYVARGGRLLVIDDLRNRKGSTANDWLRTFRMSFETRLETVAVHQPRAGHRVDLVANESSLAGVELMANGLRLRNPRPGPEEGISMRYERLSCRGGSPLLVDADGRVIAAHRPFGGGRVMLYAESAGLTNQALGGRFDPVPDAALMRRHQSALDLLEMLVELPGRKGGKNRD